MQKLIKKSIKLFSLIILLNLPLAMYAANFTIKQFGNIPSAILNDNTINVYYKVTNVTKSTRSGYYLSPLPNNVVQRFSSKLYSDKICANPLTLAGGESCLLMFEITGPVSFNFSLCNGASCTSSSLSVNLQKEVLTDASLL